MKRFFIILIALIVVFVGAAVGGLYYVNGKIYVPSKQTTANSNQNTVSKQVGTDDGSINNIILTGLDGRSKDADSRTDSIIMATIDRKNNMVKLTSFMRDMYVPVPGYKSYKINTAFFLGGPDLLMETINKNFNTNVQYYITIDFHAFQDLVDKLGGIDINIKSYEVKEINKYIKEANWHNPDYIAGPGMQHLNGQQALSYCRIRKVGNNDYERTERQRKVLSLLIAKTRKVSAFELPGLFNSVLPYIKTNIPSTKLLGLGYTIFKFGSTPVNTLRLPADNMYNSQMINHQAVLVPDLEKNIDLLHKFMTEKNLSALAENDSSKGTSAKTKGNVKTKQKTDI